jgi:hypothetical protein
MTHEQAERERQRMAAEQPKVTWLVAEQQPGDWAVVKVGLVPTDAPTGDAVEARPKPEYAEDPRTTGMQNPYGNF